MTLLGCMRAKKASRQGTSSSRMIRVVWGKRCTLIGSHTHRSMSARVFQSGPVLIFLSDFLVWCFFLAHAEKLLVGHAVVGRGCCKRT
jgi:hypothetical protein